MCGPSLTPGNHYFQTQSATGCHKHLLIDIASGLVANDKANCDNAKDVGEKLLSLIAGGSFGEVKLQREKRVIPISATSNTLIIRNESVVFNPLQLSTRIAAMLKSNENLQDHLIYELPLQPPHYLMKFL
ncbi:hypothetical protein AVEN_40041-1 [Araneus ventricosus]|uniref:Uncharacterized protein n=1 Tax=Araneus ventricosus TaxID=182803 RepID=A0A4Y2NZP3_ARAVE|nr:hypothetical protein AVEN_40041-1 [Araneus ventricosus]